MSTSQTMTATQESALVIEVGDKQWRAILEKNSSAETFKALLAKGPITISMKDFGGFEKSGPLGQSLPTNDHWIRTHGGDIALYQGNILVVFYDSHQWDLTRLARIENPGDLRAAFGAGRVTMTFRLRSKN